MTNPHFRVTSKLHDIRGAYINRRHVLSRLHGMVVKVCKSDREGTVAGRRGNGEVAPIPAIGGTVI
jgi:hypothetical protein